jgi:hypothetical protein
MFDPTNTAGMSSVLRQALVDESFRTDLLAAGNAARERHTWAAVAARICETLEAHVVPNLPANRPAARPALSVVTSDSAPDGLAAQLAAELAADADIEVFMPNPTNGAFPIEAFGRTTDPGRFDVRVFVLGDHTDGAAAFHLARRFPGVLVLTDERLTHVGATAAGTNLTSLLADAYDTRLPSVVATTSPPSVDLLLDHDVRLLAPVVQPAHRVIATTVAIAAAAALDVGPWHRQVPTDVAASAQDVAGVLRAHLATAQP